VFFNCGAVVEASDFFVSIQVRASESGAPVTDFVKTDVLIALEDAAEHSERRYLVFLDELNRCQESARNALMPALDATRRVFHPIENTFIPIPDNVQFIAAVNRGREFTGTFGIDAAQLDRFAPLQMDYPPPKAEIDRRVREMGELLELGDCLGRAPAEISGGQRQRVALGRALVRRPKLLLLDEPLSNLDAPLRAQMRRLIARLNGNLGCTMVYVTHDQTEAMMLGKRLAVMNGGMLQQIDEPQQIYRTPGNVFVAGFVGWPPMNLLSGRLVRRGTDLFFEQQSSNNSAGLVLKLNASGPGEMQTSENRQVMLGIRPEDVRNGQAVQNGAIEGVVSAIEPVGAVTLVHLEIGGGTSFIAAVSGSESLKVGERRTFTVETNRIHFFDAVTAKRLTPKGELVSKNIVP